MFCRQAKATRDIVVGILAVGLWFISGAAIATDDGRFRDAVAAYEDAEFELALEYLASLAQAGDADAQYLTGLIYALDYYEGVDADLAFEWIEKAAGQGQWMAQTFYWMAFLGAPGDNPRPSESLRWLQAAAEAGSIEATMQLATKIRSEDGLEEEYLPLIRSARDSGHVFAELAYAKHLLPRPRRPDSQRQLLEATDIYHRLAEDGLPSAQFAIGNHYILGLGVPPDLPRASAWLSLAAEHGDPEAQRAAPVVLRRLTNEERRRAQSLAEDWKQTAYNDPSRRIGRAARWCMEEQTDHSNCFRNAYEHDWYCTIELYSAFTVDDYRETELYRACRRSFIE